MTSEEFKNLEIGDWVSVCFNPFNCFPKFISRCPKKIFQKLL